MTKRDPMSLRASVTTIPGEGDIDPELLENDERKGQESQDYRESNSDAPNPPGSYQGKSGSVIPKGATIGIDYASGPDRSYVALKEKATGRTIVAWWDRHVQEAFTKGDLDPEDLHGSAYRYAMKIGALKPKAEASKRATLFTRGHVTAALTYVDPEGPDWPSFMEKLRALPVGSEIKTQAGETLTKQEDGSFSDGDLQFFPDEMQTAGDHGFPPVAVSSNP